MNLTQQLEALDARVLSGDILGAFDEFFADTCITHSSPQDLTHSKAQKLEALRWFFANLGQTNRIEYLANQVDGAETRSQFIFDFTDRQGNSMVFHEVIRRVWQDGKVIEEQYLPGATIDSVKPVKASKAATTKKAANSDAEKPTNTAAEKAIPAAKKAAVAAKAPAVKPAVQPKSDDLVLIEGIGPKIAELLVKGGIATFADLAKAKPAAIQAILDAAGKRYQMHDPASWPQQAVLARDGKTAELKKFQDELKGGRK